MGPARTRTPHWFSAVIAVGVAATRPLLLSMRMDGRFYDQQGYSRLAPENYYKKMRALAQRYNFAFIEFEDHDEDPTFLDAQHPIRTLAMLRAIFPL